MAYLAGMRRSLLLAALVLSGCDVGYVVRGSVTSLQKPLAGAIFELVDGCTDQHSLPQPHFCATAVDGTCQLVLIAERWSPPPRFLVEIWKSGYESACIEMRDVDRTECAGTLTCYRVFADLRPLRN